MLHARLTTLPFLCLALSPCYIWQWLCIDFVSALLSQIPFEIFLRYLVEMLNRCDTVLYKNDSSGFLTFGVISHCLWNWFHVCSVTWIPFRIFWWYLVEMYHRRWCVTYKKDTLPFLLLALSPLLYLTVVMHWFRIYSVSWIPFGIFLWYLVEI